MTFFRSISLGLALFGGLAIDSYGAFAAPYQQYKVGVCGTAATCTITFNPVPSGKTVELTNVSCFVSMSAGAGIKRLQLQQALANNSTPISVALPPAPYLVAFGTPAQADLGVVNLPVTLSATGGQKFRTRAEIVGGTFKEFSCHISGRI